MNLFLFLKAKNIKAGSQAGMIVSATDMLPWETKNFCTHGRVTPSLVSFLQSNYCNRVEVFYSFFSSLFSTAFTAICRLENVHDFAERCIIFHYSPPCTS